ncbi:MAG: hypothetical protein C0483_20445 [Pirellula sp.]|nr:hypothetical protein [Pirellula sp.]
MAKLLKGREFFTTEAQSTRRRGKGLQIENCKSQIANWRKRVALSHQFAILTFSSCDLQFAFFSLRALRASVVK